MNSAEQHRTDWFHQARWGGASHYLAGADLSADEWNRRVDAFDTEGLAAQLAEAGFGYYWLTIGQNSGHFCAPNETYDRLTGIRPGKCSERDLIADLAGALGRYDIPMMVYLPSGAPAADPEACRALEWEWGYEGGWPAGWGTHTGKRLASFQRKWEAVIREWSLRWGTSVVGWWFDGCYFATAMYKHPAPPNWHSFAAAARAGNPDSILAFNPGIRIEPHSPEEDFVAGEINELDTMEVSGRWLTGVDGHQAQLHVWSYMGQHWMKGPVRFTPEQVIAYTRKVTDAGGVMTWDLPLQENGRLEQSAERLLSAAAARIEGELR